MNHPWYLYLAWILASGLAGFAVTEVCSYRLHISRSLLLAPYVIVVAGLFLGYLAWTGLDLVSLLEQNWLLGCIGAAVVSVIVVKNVLAQPASPRSRGLALAGEVLWAGVVYGVADAVLLSVLPVLATWQMGTALGWTVSWPGKALVGGLCVLASVFVTTAYHYGYAEFRGRRMRTAWLGNTIMSLGYLLTTNPIAAIFSHALMHVTAVLHGPSSTVQLPPHYS